jgi:hypothetical protein
VRMISPWGFAASSLNSVVSVTCAIEFGRSVLAQSLFVGGGELFSWAIISSTSILLEVIVPSEIRLHFNLSH